MSSVSKFLLTIFLLILFQTAVEAQSATTPSNSCSGATQLTSSTCGTDYTMVGSDYTVSSGEPISCSTPTYDVWFWFIAQSVNPTISLTITTSTGKNFNGSGLQILSGSCGSFISKGCVSGTSLTASNLIVGTKYYVRVFGTSSIPSSKGNFNICISDPPSNDDCSNAISLTSATSCSSTTGGVALSTSSGGSNCAGTIGYDVWYKFVAQSANPAINLNVIGSNFTNPGLELLSGCSGTSIACTSGLTLSPTGLTIGNTYYIRVFSTSSTIPSTNADFTICVTDPFPTSRTYEVFQQTTLSGANVLNDPWEVTYGPDDSLWVTESKGYKVYKIDPVTFNKITILDISNGAIGGGLTAAEHTTFNCKFTTAQNPWPQGGCAGFAIHPEFMTDPNKKFVYLSYVASYDSTSVNTNAGVFFTNKVVRFTYDPSTKQLKNPVAVCDTLPGSSDHNSQRMIIAPVNGTNYLFYAAGDMGAGQFGNANRINHAQLSEYYEGKILRFNLEPDNTGVSTLDKWIPADNPFNGTKRSAVWVTGIRNNQGFGYANINGTGILYGSSHGPFSDDEINIIEKARNYGHPLVIGYASDNNYNGCSAGEKTGKLPVISSETSNAATIGASYKDPLFSAYDANNTKVTSIWNNQTNNGAWPSEAWSGMEVYTNSVIPAWKNSLVLASLKWGRIIRMKLDNNGTDIVPTNGADTVTFFGSTNRYRDVAFAPNGRDLYVIMDKSSTTSGPSALNPTVPACAGCLIKYTFLGYKNDLSTNKSTIPDYIPVSTPTTTKTCTPASTVTINAANQNNNLWVPFTGPDGNIIAEVNAKGNDLGAMTASYYVHSGSLREDGAKRAYAQRSLTITPATQPTSPVSVRLYLTKAEFDAMVGATNSQGVSTGVSSISDLRIWKNSDACGTPFTTTGIWITPTYAEAFGSDGYVLQADISSFSTFYFTGQSMSVLPVELLSFEGSMQKNAAYLTWSTSHEKNVASFDVERSVDGRSFTKIGQVAVDKSVTTEKTYSYVDREACNQLTSKIYYRLKVLDANGNYSYSKVVGLECVPAAITLEVYPNPVHHELNVRIALLKADHIRIEVSDMTGRIIYAQNRFVAGGTNEMNIPTESWPAQMYTVKVTTANGKIISTKSVIKQ